MCSPDHLANWLLHVSLLAQVVGFTLALWGIHGTWRFSRGQEPLRVRAFVLLCARWMWSKVWATLVRVGLQVERRLRWAVRKPRRRNANIVTGTAGMSVQAGMASITVGWPEPPTDAEGRLAWLEERVRALKAQADIDRQTHTNDMAAIRGEMAEERAARAEADAHVHATLREFAGSGLRLAVFGVMLFLFAAFGSTVPVGLAHSVRSVISVVHNMHQPRCKATG
jgi:hypothetical protein